MMDSIDFKDKKVLEIGHGPGGNLAVIHEKAPKLLHGADISQAMIDLASKNLSRQDDIRLHKINGTELPFEADQYDQVLTVTVLQHNTDEDMLKPLIAEMCRTSGGEIHIFERIDDPISGDELCLGRPVEYYAKLFSEHGFRLARTEFINIQVSYLVCGSIRKLLNRRSRKEGEALNKPSLLLQALLLPITKLLDKVFKAKRDLALLSFETVK